MRIHFGSLKDINAFIESFKEAQLLGAKALDYADFCKAVDLMNSKNHLTQEGLVAIRAIASGMNSTRVYFGKN